MSNPFNTTFGELPHSFIEREKEENIVWDTFKSEIPETKVYIITGPRSSGKTVLLTKLKRRFKDSGYLTVDLSSYMDTEEQLAAKLYEEGRLWKLFLTPDFSFSFHGISFAIDGANKNSNVATLFEKMFNYLQKTGKRVLVTINDVSDSEKMRKFVFLF